MSPRPRATSDAQIFAATHRAVSRLGPVKLTLARVAAEAGVSPATLVQRFGSKRGLLLAFAANGSGAGDEAEVIRRKHTSPLEALAAYADCFAGLAPTPEVLANNLAFLQIDLVDPDFRKLADAAAQSTRQEIRKFLDDAVKSGELQPCDTLRLAMAVAGMMNGSLLQWAIDREGDVKERMRADLDTLLRPRRVPTRKTRRRHARR
ncbi:MAG TPA: TetR/AcrR family transcriptional regulator [Vicinamibacterales bacterium]|jgi:AcrR family transcriptional regulator